MKKMTVLLSLLAVLVLGLSMTFANGPADVQKGIWCGVPDASGGSFITYDSHSVVSNDKNGNTKLTCHGQVTDPDTYPEKTMHLDFSNTGIPCGTLLGITTDWKAVVTPSGNVKLTCHINPNPTP
ncbi:MAG: hypothetical protein KAJ88_01905 [Candidatus Aenigmarchaeota archaeon]|nr:hypothetical protein [Candidatus Aenigmarchaeota archaeon]